MKVKFYLRLTQNVPTSWGQGCNLSLFPSSGFTAQWLRRLVGPPLHLRLEVCDRPPIPSPDYLLDPGAGPGWSQGSRYVLVGAQKVWIVVRDLEVIFLVEIIY